MGGCYYNPNWFDVIIISPDPDPSCYYVTNRFIATTRVIAQDNSYVGKLQYYTELDPVLINVNSGHWLSCNGCWQYPALVRLIRMFLSTDFHFEKTGWIS